MPEIITLSDLFEDELRDVYDAEQQIVRGLPRLIRSVSAADVRAALEAHLEETRNQIERLDCIFEELALTAGGTHCLGMEGILDEAAELMDEGGHEAVLDAGYIAAAQRIEHYEMTSYRSLIAWAEILGYGAALPLLRANEQEEKTADAQLSHLARSINQHAAAAGFEAHARHFAGAK
jgi:ferritin-like metal-binding protein YciE